MENQEMVMKKSWKIQVEKFAKSVGILVNSNSSDFEFYNFPDLAVIIMRVYLDKIKN